MLEFLILLKDAPIFGRSSVMNSKIFLSCLILIIAVSLVCQNSFAEVSILDNSKEEFVDESIAAQQVLVVEDVDKAKLNETPPADIISNEQCTEAKNLHEKLSTAKQIEKITVEFKNGKTKVKIKRKNKREKVETKNVGSIVLGQTDGAVNQQIFGTSLKDGGKYLYLVTPWNVFQFSHYQMIIDIKNGTTSIRGYACKAPNGGDGTYSKPTSCGHVTLPPAERTENFIEKSLAALEAQMASMESCTLPTTP